MDDPIGLCATSWVEGFSFLVCYGYEWVLSRSTTRSLDRQNSRFWHTPLKSQCKWRNKRGVVDSKGTVIVHVSSKASWSSGVCTNFSISLTRINRVIAGAVCPQPRSRSSRDETISLVVSSVSEVQGYIVQMRFWPSYLPSPSYLKHGFHRANLKGNRSKMRVTKSPPTIYGCDGLVH